MHTHTHAHTNTHTRTHGCTHIHTQVHGSHKKKHQWTVSYHDNEVEGANKGGKWAQLNAVEQEKYIKMHNGELHNGLACVCVCVCVC